ncbi:oxidoreductase [Nocardia sp. NPDC003963]
MVSTDTTPWTVPQAGALSGRIAVVTGANTGIGLEIARVLAVAGATVVSACRDSVKAQAAERDIRASAPDAHMVHLPLDLASLASVASLADRLRGRWPHIDLLVNNAGVMAAHHGHTADGFETDFGTNFLGHFALTGRLFDLLEAAPASRVVTVSSITHRGRGATLDFDDPHGERHFDSTTAYARSKMASMTFMCELNRRLIARGSAVEALAAHPGGVRTDILQERNRLMRAVYHPRLSALTSWFTQSPAAGATPILRAALDRTASGGDFFGPGGRGELIGPPVPVRISRRALDPVTGRRLWDLAQRATGVHFLDDSDNPPR